CTAAPKESPDQERPLLRSDTKNWFVPRCSATKKPLQLPPVCAPFGNAAGGAGTLPGRGPNTHPAEQSTMKSCVGFKATPTRPELVPIEPWAFTAPAAERDCTRFPA